MATTSLSYHIWKETRHDFAPSLQNKARLRRVALGLIETGFIYFAFQLSYTVILVKFVYDFKYSSSGTGPVLVWYVTSVLNAQIPVRWLVHIIVSVITDVLIKLYLPGNIYNPHCCQNQHYQYYWQSPRAYHRSIYPLAVHQ